MGFPYRYPWPISQLASRRMRSWSSSSTPSATVRMCRSLHMEITWRTTWRLTRSSQLLLTRLLSSFNTSNRISDNTARLLYLVPKSSSDIRYPRSPKRRSTLQIVSLPSSPILSVTSISRRLLSTWYFFTMDSTLRTMSLESRVIREKLKEMVSACPDLFQRSIIRHTSSSTNRSMWLIRFSRSRFPTNAAGEITPFSSS